MGKKRTAAARAATLGAVALLLALPARGDSGLPNLIVASSSTSVSGTTVDLTFRIANTGTATASASRWASWLSSDGTLDTGDVRLNGASTPALGVGASVQVSTVVSLPAGTPDGTHCVIVQADAEGQVDESDETDDTRASCFTVAPQVDLAPQGLSAPASVPFAGGAATVSFAVVNQKTSASLPSTAAVYLSNDQGYDGSDTRLGQVEVGAIAAGGSSGTLRVPVTIPFLVPRTYYLLVSVDDGGTNDETNEQNNVAASPLTSLGVDLVAAVSAHGSTVQPGGSIEVSFTIRNTGTVAASASSWGLYLSSDEALSADDRRVSLQPTPALGAGGSSALVTTVTPVPAGLAAGRYCMLVRADALDEVGEAVESDNVSPACFDLAAVVDLSVSGLAGPQTMPPAGGQAPLSFTVRNGGNAAAGATTVGIYLSSDATFGAGDVSLAQLPLGALASSESAALAPTVSVPPCPPGRYFLLVVVDPDRQLPDVDRSNDAAASAFDVFAPNLKATVSSGPSSVLSTGGPTNVTFSIRNAGNVAAAPTRYAVYLSDDPTLSADDLALADQPLPGGQLSGGGAASVSTIVTIPPATPPVLHCLLVQSDAGGSVDESDETDNVGSWCFPVVAPELVPPVTVATAPGGATLAGWNRDSVTVHLAATDASGVWELHWSVGGGPAQKVRGSSVDVQVAAEGETSIAFHAVDRAANVEAERTAVVRIDRTAPAVSCEQPDAAWHDANVSFACAAADPASGVAGSTAFQLSTSVPDGVETGSAQTASREVCDVAGNCTTVGPIAGVRVDRKLPVVSCPSPGGSWHPENPSFTCTVVDGGSGPVAPTFVLTTSVAPGTETPTATTGSYEACDIVGHCVVQAPLGPVKVDRKAPSTTCESPDGVWHASNRSFACSGSDGGSGMASPATVAVATSVPAGAETAAAETGTAELCDAVGNCAPVGPLGPVKVDRKAPTLACSEPGDAWRAANVEVGCDVSDGGSGLAGPASLTLSTAVAAGEEDAVAATGSEQVCDAVGNCATAGPFHARVDRKAPAVAIAAPAGAYVVGDRVAAAYSCSDGGSGVAACAGATPAGAAVDTSEPGSFSFAVEARDAVGNVAHAASQYTVEFALCSPSDVPPGPAGGDTIRVWLVVCDASGRDVATKDTVVTAVDVDGRPVRDLPGNRTFHREQKFGFRYDLDGGALAPGTHVLHVSVSGDPVVHAVRFDVPKPPPGASNGKGKKKR